MKSFAQLAHTYSEQNVEGWYVSRKLNGWGCIWDGGITRGMPAEEVPWYSVGGDYRLRVKPRASGLWTIGRGGKPKVINAPMWWLDKLPKGIPWQGELWSNDDLPKVKSICGQGVRGISDMRWKEINFMVYNIKPYCLFSNIKLFDVSTKHFFNTSWVTRTTAARENTKNNDVIHVINQKKIQGDLDKYLVKSRENDWEGLMLTNGSSSYTCRRSWNLLKIKPKYDAEAKIIGFTEGEGSNAGLTGAIICRLVWDDKVLGFTGGTPDMIGKTVEFKIGGGLSEEERKWGYFTPQEIINFTFSNVTKKGIPAHANYNRVVSCAEEIPEI